MPKYVPTANSRQTNFNFATEERIKIRLMILIYVAH